MNVTKKYSFLLILTLVAIGSVFLVPPIGQPLSYHDFADKRSLWGIPNFTNVISNIPFLIVGIIGFMWIHKSEVAKGIVLIYTLLFAGILLTGLGSGYYHWVPDNDTLIYDRIPLSIVFMALLSATIAELINYKLGTSLLLPLVLLGIASVLWWHYTERQGHGDLRLYGFVQFYPVIVIPIILLLFYNPKQKPAMHALGWVVIWYGIAKISELLDKRIYLIGGFVSGHTLKHLAAAISTWYLVKMYRLKYDRNK